MMIYIAIRCQVQRFPVDDLENLGALQKGGDRLECPAATTQRNTSMKKRVRILHNDKSRGAFVENRSKINRTE